MHPGGVCDQRRVQERGTLTDIRIACTLRARLRGLYGRASFDGVLLLAPCNDVHTLRMRRSLDVAFVDAGGVVLAVHRNVEPNSRLRNKGACATLERFASEEPWFENGDRICLAGMAERSEASGRPVPKREEQQ